jgi:uncharacterized protein (DUF885 family)
MAPAVDPRATFDFASFKRRTFEAHLGAEPEEGTTLGAPGCDARLRDSSMEGAESELARHIETLRTVQQLPRETLTTTEQLDCDTMARFAQFQRHTIEDLETHTCNMDASVYAHAIIQYQVARASTEAEWVDVWRRVRELPRALAQQESLLTIGKQRKKTPDRTIAAFVTQHQLPAIAKFFATSLADLPGQRGIVLTAKTANELRTAGLAAADAYASHIQFLSESIVSAAGDSWALGPEEYKWRLRNSFGIADEPSVLIAKAEAVIHTAHEELKRVGHALGVAGTGETNSKRAVMHATSETLRAMEGDRPHDDEVLTVYQELLVRLSAFVRERRLFRIAATEKSLVLPMPAGMLHGASISNWPAPLMNARNAGCVVVRLGSEFHPKVRAALLAAHEGIPGHFLQSVAWQRRFGDDDSPVRFLNTADDVAMLRQYYAPMLNIEGFATYAEEFLREHGFYSLAEELFAVMCRIFRAVRLLIDVSLHCKTMNPEEAVNYIVNHTSFSRETAAAEILRYQRLPMQGVTYLLGALQLEETRREMQQQAGNSFLYDAFHERVLEFGPVPPSVIRSRMNDESRVRAL